MSEAPVTETERKENEAELQQIAEENAQENAERAATQQSLREVLEQATTELLEGTSEENTDEDTVEETVQPEPESEEAEVEDAQTEEHTEVNEAEPELPEWVAELNLENELEYEAANYWNGGERAEWTRKQIQDMTPEEKGAFTKAQSYRAKWRASQVAQPEPEPEKPRSFEEAWENALKIAENRPDLVNELRGAITPTKKAVREEEKPTAPQLDREKIKQAFETMDADGFAEYMAEAEAQLVKHAEENILKKVDGLVESKISQREKGLEQKAHYDQLEREYDTLMQTDPDFEKYAQPDEWDANGQPMGSPVTRWLGIKNPLTGKVVNSLREGLDLCVRLEGGGKKNLPRPSANAQPPAGSSHGEENYFSEAYFNRPLHTGLREEWEKHFNK